MFNFNLILIIIKTATNKNWKIQRECIIIERLPASPADTQINKNAE